MQYDNPLTIAYSYPNYDFGAAAGAGYYSFKGPKGYKGRIIDVGAHITEATIFATTLGFVEVGTAADPDANCKLNIATAQAVKTTFNTVNDTDAIIAADVAADTNVVVKLTEGTGASLAGQGVPYVVVNWFK
jgi:hypothetical protein